MRNGIIGELEAFSATDNSLECILVDEEDVNHAIENWSAVDFIDNGVFFSTDCSPLVFFPNTSVNLVSVQGENNQFDISLSNNGTTTLNYSFTVNATSMVYTWLSVAASSGHVPPQSTATIPVDLEQTENIPTGSHTGYLYFNTNTGPDPNTIIANTDTVAIFLNLFDDGIQLSNSTTDVAAGDAPPITIVDDNGDDVGIVIDFAYSDGGSVTVQTVGLQPPIGLSIEWEDPDGLINDPVFPDKYFEIGTDITSEYWVDIGLDYSLYQGINNPESLRLAKRTRYAGAGDTWTIIPVADTEIANGMIVANNQTSFSQWAVLSNASDNDFQDAEGPLISNMAISPIQPSILEAVVVTSSLSDYTGVDGATLYYRTGHDDAYSSAPMSVDGGIYSGTIPAASVGISGLFYFVIAQDALGNSSVSDTLSSSVQFISGSVSTSSVVGSAYPSGFPSDVWRMISIPAVLNTTGVGLVIGDELGTQIDTTWRLFKYQQTIGTYVDNPAGMDVGMSYWLYQKVGANLSISTPEGETGDMEGTTITLGSGWNFIGAPYPFPVDIALDQVLFYGPISYGLTSESWSSVVNQLNPWNGYAVYNRTASNKTITIDPKGSIGAARSARTIGEQGWSMNLQAIAGPYRDQYNTIGVLLNAKDDLDWNDNPEIRAPGSSVSLFFNISETDKQHDLTSDLRSIDENIKIWDVRLRCSDIEEDVIINWSLKREIPAGNLLKLIDLSTRNVIDMVEQKELYLDSPDGRFDRQIKILYGGTEQAAIELDNILSLVPEKLSLHGNYPNPFNPVTTIRYGLPQPREIRITIVNILGQEIKELVNGWKDIGHYEVKWNGQDHNGNPVASGVYFTIISDGEALRSHKIMMIK